MEKDLIKSENELAANYHRTRMQKEMVLQSLNKISQQRDLQRSTFFRDKSEGWKDYVLFELLNILSSAIGSLTNPSKLSVTLKSVKTVK